MASIKLLVLGLLPALALTVWEASRRGRSRRVGSCLPPCAEGFRWTLYTAAVWELSYAGLALAWLDGQQAGHGASAALVAVVLSTTLASLLLMWHFGERYSPSIPRLGDWREAVYLTRITLTRRARALRYQAYHGGAGGDEHLVRINQLTSDANRQLHRLALALSTQAFLARVRREPAARAELTTIIAEQRRLLGSAHEVLAATARLAVAPEHAVEPAALVA